MYAHTPLRTAEICYIYFFYRLGGLIIKTG